MVPDIRNIGSWSWTTSPNPHTDSTGDHPDIRDLATGLSVYPDPYGTGLGSTATLDSLGTGGTNWMMYACIYNQTSPGVNTNTAQYITGTGETASQFTNGSTGTTLNGWSMSMVGRVTALTGTIVSSEGTALPASSTDTTGGALWTNTSFNSGGGGVPNYPGDAYTEITPYDTVMSVMVDPGSANKYLQGDPRLANIMGEDLVFNTSKAVYTSSVRLHHDSRHGAQLVSTDFAVFGRRSPGIGFGGGDKFRHRKPGVSDGHIPVAIPPSSAILPGKTP